MKLISPLIACLSLAIFLTGCPGSSPTPSPSPSASPPPTLTGLGGAICDVESTITSDFGAAIVSSCAGTDAVACGGALQSALGAINLCGQPGVSQVTMSQIKAAKASRASAKIAGQVSPNAIVGNLVCPLAVPAIMGLLSGLIPSACGCTQSIGASTIQPIFVSACEAAIPI